MGHDKVKCGMCGICGNSLSSAEYSKSAYAENFKLKRHPCSTESIMHQMFVLYALQHHTSDEMIYIWTISFETASVATVLLHNTKCLISEIDSKNCRF